MFLPNIIIKVLHLKLFHRFLNKSVTIAAEERGTNDIFAPVGIAAGYTWNSVSIAGTDILHSISIIGRKLHFPIDININDLSKMTKKDDHWNI